MTTTHLQKGFRDLIVWQSSMDLVVRIYELTKLFPSTELYSLTSQLRRAAISIPSNIAEGSKRGSKKYFRNFVFIAYGSGAELQTQIEIAQRLKYISEKDAYSLQESITSIMRMLFKLASALEIKSVQKE